MKKVRLTVDVSPDLNAALEKIAEANGITKAEAFRRAIILADVTHEAVRKGQHVGIAADSDSLKREFVGL